MSESDEGSSELESDDEDYFSDEDYYSDESYDSDDDDDRINEYKDSIMYRNSEQSPNMKYSNMS